MPRHYHIKPRSRPTVDIPRIKAHADPRLKSVFAAIGVPEPRPFEPDPFQLEALAAVEEADCLVTAPTGSGKTWIAEQVIARLRAGGKRAWYASPLKALTNSKYAQFTGLFGAESVGILTGDRKENTDAPIIVGTTEILRNQLYDAMHLGEDVATDLVILDEAHFLGDPERGVVWEEVMIYLPPRIPLLMLSATIGNARQIAHWLSSIRGRPCAVVKETRRPVDLCHLFFHPSGTLLPLLARSKDKDKPKLDPQVRAFAELADPPQLCRPYELPPFGQIIRVLRRYNLLPAIFFLKSRADCDKALSLCEVQEGDRPEGLPQRIDELVGANPHLAAHPQLRPLRSKAVGAHHAGQLPAWKLILETLMTEGLLDAVFATSTVAAGVNFPARSVVFLNSDRYDGSQFAPLTPTEFHQMIGRAGRRGMDRIGFAIAVPGKFMDVRAIARLAASPPSDVLSQIQINFSMVLNLLLSHTPDQVEGLLEKTFAAYARRGHASSEKDSKHAHKRLLRDFQRHLAFLIERGYVHPGGTLTDTGRWASQLRVDQPLLIAESLRLGLLPEADPALFAAIVASFVNDRQADEELEVKRLPRELVLAFAQVQIGLNAFATLMLQRGFPLRPLYLNPAVTMHAWASQQSWSEVVARSNVAEGDLAMLIFRTADNLRHINTLGRVFPLAAQAAGRAVEIILRQPVTMEYE